MMNCCCSSEACRLNGCQANKGMANPYNALNPQYYQGMASQGLGSATPNDQSILASAIHRLAAAIEKMADKS